MQSEKMSGNNQIKRVQNVGMQFLPITHPSKSSHLERSGKQEYLNVKLISYTNNWGDLTPCYD
ncbi:MAG: hypothetical protein PHO77_01900 [Bacteroidales bacterium]|nr:hypothetical protein [Bacteroidales bacterium]